MPKKKQKQKKIKENNRPNYIPLKKIKTVDKLLGREKAMAQTFVENDIYIIEIDKRQSEKELLGSYIHEINHQIFQNLNEKDIIKIEKTISNYLWSLGYRRVNLK